MENTTETPRRRNKSILSYFGIVISVLVILGIILLNTNDSIRNLIYPNSQTNQAIVKPSLKPLNNPPATSQSLTFQGCGIKKEGNPLVEGVRTSGGDIIGTLYGNIDKIDSQAGSTKINLISPKGEQTYELNLTEEKGLVYDGIDQKDLKLNNLARGQTIVASFNCFPKQNNLFKITKITLVGR